LSDLFVSSGSRLSANTMVEVVGLASDTATLRDLSSKSQGIAQTNGLSHKIEVDKVGSVLQAVKQRDDAYVSGMLSRVQLPVNGAARVAYRRLKEMQDDTISFISLSPVEDNLCDLLGSIEGPPGTPYEGGVFWIRLELGSNFPLSAPICTFLTKILHPNIDAQGHICLDVLCESWKPLFGRLDKLLLGIGALLCDPVVEDPLVPEVAELYSKHRLEYEAAARRYTKMFAINKAPELRSCASKLQTIHVSNHSHQVTGPRDFSSIIEDCVRVNHQQWPESLVIISNKVKEACAILSQSIIDRLQRQSVTTGQREAIGQTLEDNRTGTVLSEILSLSSTVEQGTLSLDSVVHDIEPFLILIDTWGVNAFSGLLADSSIPKSDRLPGTDSYTLSIREPLLKDGHNVVTWKAMKRRKTYARLSRVILNSSQGAEWEALLRDNALESDGRAMMFNFFRCNLIAGPTRDIWQLLYLKKALRRIETTVEALGGTITPYVELENFDYKNEYHDPGWRGLVARNTHRLSLDCQGQLRKRSREMKSLYKKLSKRKVSGTRNSKLWSEAAMVVKELYQKLNTLAKYKFSMLSTDKRNHIEIRLYENAMNAEKQISKSLQRISEMNGGEKNFKPSRVFPPKDLISHFWRWNAFYFVDEQAMEEFIQKRQSKYWCMPSAQDVEELDMSELKEVSIYFEENQRAFRCVDVAFEQYLKEDYARWTAGEIIFPKHVYNYLNEAVVSDSLARRGFENFYLEEAIASIRAALADLSTEIEMKLSVI
jgi:ubiquitin-conjugating enzyme E2 D/E